MRPFTWNTGQKLWGTDRKHFQCTGESKGVCGTTTKMSGENETNVCRSGISLLVKVLGSQVTKPFVDQSREIYTMCVKAEYFLGKINGN